jgi:hypothetical protein
MLESVAGTASDKPNILHSRMPVDDEVAVRSLLILAYPRFEQRRIFQGRKAKSDVFANALEDLGIDHALAIGRIEGRSARIVGDFEPAAGISGSAAGNAVEKADVIVRPDRQVGVAEAIISRRRTEEENFLLGGLDEIANRFRKEFSKPWPASKNVNIGLQTRTVRQVNVTQWSMLQAAGSNGKLFVLAAGCDEGFDYRLATRTTRFLRS